MRRGPRERREPVGWVEQRETHRNRLRQDDGYRCAQPILLRPLLSKTWMAGTSPAMTDRILHEHFGNRRPL
jgi:hypothetical protein